MARGLRENVGKVSEKGNKRQVETRRRRRRLQGSNGDEKVRENRWGKKVDERVLFSHEKALNSASNII